MKEFQKNKAKSTRLKCCFIALALCLSCTGLVFGEPYLHIPSGFECPDEITGFVRTEIQDYESRQPGLGVACKYQLDKDLFADVYLFTAGLADVPKEITHPLLLRLQQQTLNEIEQYAQSRGETTRSGGSGIINVTTDRGSVSVLFSSVIISSLNGARNTWLWLWPSRNHVMKIRMTRPPSGKADQKKLKAFIEMVVSLAAN